MFGRAKILLTIAACALAIPAAAQTPAPTTAFDGTYAGVSQTTKQTGKASRQHCPSNGVPAPLTIGNGVVGTPSSGGWEGAVSQQGALVIRDSSSARVEGQIDRQGTITGRFKTSGCHVDYVWRKQS
jgi:hypothetical protein